MVNMTDISPAGVAVTVGPRRPAPAAGSRADTPAMSLTATIVLLGGAFLPMLSFFVVNVALHGIGVGLRADPAMLQLVVGSYGIANAALVVIGGRLGDSHGRKRMFLAGMAGFALTSLACGLAPTAAFMLGARVLQGALAALMTPQVLATIGATLEGQHRVRAIGLFGAAGGIAAALGQVLGGALVEADVFGLGWRAVFLVFVPLALVGLVAGWRLIPETISHERLPLDAGGAALLTATLVLLLLPLTEGRPLGWPTWTWAAMGAAAVGAVALGVHQRGVERSGRTALVPPSVLALRPMRLGLITAVCFFTTFGGFMFVFALATQAGAGLSPVEGGLALLPMAIAFMVVSIVLPRIQARFGARTLVAGWAVQLVAYSALALEVRAVWPHVTPLNLAIPMAFAGLGGVLVMMPMFGVVLAQVPPHQSGLGSGILITTQQTCLALGAATVGTAYLSLAGTRGAGAALEAVCVLAAGVSLVGLPLGISLARGTQRRR